MASTMPDAQPRELQDAAEIAAVDLLCLGQLADGCIPPVPKQLFPFLVANSAARKLALLDGRPKANVGAVRLGAVTSQS